MLASVVNLALNGGQAVVDLLELGLEVLHVLAHRGEARLDVSQRVRVRAVVTSHALEVAGEDALLARDLVERAARVVLQPLQLAAHLGQGAAHLPGERLRLLEVGAPLLAALADLAQLELVGDSLDFELPLLLADVRLDDGLLRVLGLQLASHLRLDVATAEVQVLVDVVAALVRVDLVCEVCVALHIVATVVGFVVAALAFIANNRLFELETPSQASLSQLEEDEADTLAITSFEFVRVDIDFEAKILELDNDVLTSSHGVIILVPASDLVLVDCQKP